MFNDPKYCIELKLIQQTPMIHFQATEGMVAGLGPRATEVKPKLDRFAASWYKKNNSGKDIPAEWMIEYEEQPDTSRIPEHHALNYVLWLLAPNNKPAVIDLNDKNSKTRTKSVYFGYMSKDNRDHKYQIFNSAPLTLYIRCFIPELKKLLEDCIPTFFLMHNFGTRQDKGLGCFVTEGMTADKAKMLIKRWMGSSVVGVLDYSNYQLNEKQLENGDFWIGEIGTVYRLLKSGINVNSNDPNKDTYVKSGLTEYFLRKQISGEKKLMKEKGIAPIVITRKTLVNKTTTSSNKNQERYIRGLFGYGQVQSWFKADQSHQKIPDPKKKNNYLKEDIKISPSSTTDIKRVPSPLLFKVVDKCIFIIPGKIEVFGQSFDFSSASSSKPLTLSIPEENEFDMNDFLRWYMNWLDKKGPKRGIVKSNIFSHAFENSHVVKKCL